MLLLDESVGCLCPPKILQLAINNSYFEVWGT